MGMEHNRKTIRLKGYDYNSPGCYFITICTVNKEKLLGDIVGTGLPDGPETRLSPCGTVAQKQLLLMKDFYKDIKLDKFVVMPNHVHFLLRIMGPSHGPSGRPVPTNSKVSQFVGTFKRFCSREYGRNVWQSRSHDHIVRSEKEYLTIWEYIDNNPARWLDDCFYVDD